MIDKTLNDYIERVRPTLFEWGKMDCVFFVAEWIKEVTSIDMAAESLGAYNDEETAYAHLKEKYGSIEESLDEHFGRIDKSFRQKGDVVVAHIQGQDVLGICGARGFVFFKAKPKGIFGRRNPEILETWRIE